MMLLKKLIYPIIVNFVFLVNTAFGLEFSATQAVDIKKHADDIFSFGDYDEALRFYYDLADQKNASNKIKADSWKKAGIIRYHQGNYIEAKDHIGKAEKLGLSDKKTKEILGAISKIKDMNNNDGANSYVIQIGFFKSSVNANNVIKNISPIDGEFSLVKKKTGSSYVVYFDGLKNKDEADRVATQLKSLNNNLDFFVKIKGY